MGMGIKLLLLHPVLNLIQLLEHTVGLLLLA
jgi:hypothetical protein